MEILNLADHPAEKIPNRIKSYVEYLMTKADLPVFDYNLAEEAQLEGFSLPLYCKNLDFSGELLFYII